MSAPIQEESTIGPALRTTSDFGWKDVSCFLRPQAELLRDIRKNGDMLFLFLVSFYRAHGVDGFFTDPTKDHAAFMTDVVQHEIGFRYSQVTVRDRHQVLEAVKDLLEAGTRPIVAAHLRDWPEPLTVADTDRAHHFVVTGYDPDRRVFSGYDNLATTAHVASAADMREMPRTFGPGELREHDLVAAIELFWRERVDTDPRQSYQLHCVAAPDADHPVDTRHMGSPAERILAWYRHLDATSGVSVDQHYFKALTARREGGADAQHLERLGRQYLVAANLANVHRTIVADALAATTGTPRRGLIDELAEMAEHTNRRRSKLLVQQMLPRNLAGHARHTLAELVDLETTSRQRLHAALRTSGIEAPVGTLATKPGRPRHAPGRWPVTETTARIDEICCQVLGVDRLDPEQGFFEQGGDSLRLVRCIARIHEALDLVVPTSAFQRARTLREIYRLVLDEGTLAPTPALPQARIDETQAVPMIANRYSYFLKRQRNLAHWHVASGLLEPTDRLDIEAMRTAAGHLVERHDALRLRIFEQDGVWRQECPPKAANPWHEATLETLGDPESDHTPLHGLIQEIQASIAFPDQLFHVVHIRVARPARAFVFVIAHHLLADGYSMGLIVKDLLTFYACSRAQRPLPVARNRTSFAEYSTRSITAWQARSARELDHWQSRPWSLVRQLKPERRGTNREQHTVFEVASMPVATTDWMTRRWGEHGRFNWIHVLLGAIAQAYGEWTGDEILQLAMLLHGRDSFEPGINLGHTVGWISETVPLLLPTEGGDQALEAITAELDHAHRRGKAYGVLRYLTPDAPIRRAFERFPEPEISLNVVLPGLRAWTWEGFTRAAEGRNLTRAPLPTTERAFLLSGGVFLENDQLRISWDFSKERFSPRTVRGFTDACMTNLESALARHLGDDFASLAYTDREPHLRRPETTA